MGGIAQQCLDIERVADLLHEFQALVDDGDVVAGAGEIAGDVEADLACTRNDDLHGIARPWWRPATLDPRSGRG
jgi:hypothetical protein